MDKRLLNANQQRRVVTHLRRRVMATAEVWASSMEDVKARHLKAYGHIHPELAGVLDPRIDDLVLLLQTMADLANRLPDR